MAQRLHRPATAEPHRARTGQQPRPAQCRTQCENGERGPEGCQTGLHPLVVVHTAGHHRLVRRCSRHQVVLAARHGQLECRPLRQPAQPEAQRPDAAAGHTGLPDGGTDQHHQRHCQSLLHVAHARPSERDHRGYDHSYQRYVGHDEAADEPGTRPLYQCAERRGCLL